METVKIDFTAILAFLVFLEILFVMVRSRIGTSFVSGEALHHLGTHMLLKIGFIFAVISFKILDDAIFISVWGIYAFWHIHIENKNILNGKHYI